MMKRTQNSHENHEWDSYHEAGRQFTGGSCNLLLPANKPKYQRPGFRRFIEVQKRLLPFAQAAQKRCRAKGIKLQKRKAGF
jgi:hypothetical protein